MTERRRLPKYIIEYESPKGSGTWFVYYRRKGQKAVRMYGTPYSDDWMATYHALLAGAVIATSPNQVTPVVDQTFAWLCQQYMASTDFTKKLDARTQRVRRGILDSCMKEPLIKAKPDGKKYADLPLSHMNAKSIAMLRDRKEDLPEAANGRIKSVRAVFKWASSAEVGIVHTNPAKDVQNRKSNNPDGFHSWTIEEVEQFEARHNVGTTARLALALLLYTGQRRSDVVLLGRGHEKDGWLHLTQQKNRRNKPVTLDIPIRPELRVVIDATVTGSVTYLINELGRSFTANGFGNKMRDWCDRAGLPLCSAHGLRKACATRLADAGASPHEIMAITGHKTLKEVERYTRAANQRKLAAAASDRRS